MAATGEPGFARRTLTSLRSRQRETAQRLIINLFFPASPCNIRPKMVDKAERINVSCGNADVQSQNASRSRASSP
jgi:hypothetical protein